MFFTWIDWLCILAFLLLSIWINYRQRERAGRSMEEYLLAGRSMPWYIAGLSMVATTFAADTPLAVTELVVEKGIAGNWLWWAGMAGGMLTVFVFARLWQRSGVLTEAAFVELRYSGKYAAFLRGFKAVYLGLFLNLFVIAWVNVAFLSLLKVFFALSFGQALGICALIMLLTALLSSLSGLRGVALTDAFQFALALGGCIVLAYLVVESEEIGGMASLVQKIELRNPETLHFIPDWSSASIEDAALGFGAFLTYITVQWWASWSPGAEPGGGGYVAQRLMSTGSAQHAVYAGLLFQLAHYTLRPWPWIVVALATLLLYPDLDESRLGYVYAMRDFLPSGLQGLLFVAFMAAYMSTISTQLNWGAGYLVHDLYRRFLRPNEEEKHYVQSSRWATLLLMFLGLGLSVFVESISGLWAFLMQCGAGLGLVLILRWYWWRINAQAELAASIAPLPLTVLFWYLDWGFPSAFLYTVAGTTLAWLLVMYSTEATEEERLRDFYKKVHKRDYSSAARPSLIDSSLAYSLLGWLSALLLAYSLLFGFGYWLLGYTQSSLVALALALLGLLGVFFSLRRMQEEESAGG